MIGGFGINFLALPVIKRLPLVWLCSNQDSPIIVGIICRNTFSSYTLHCPPSILILSCLLMSFVTLTQVKATTRQDLRFNLFEQSTPWKSHSQYTTNQILKKNNDEEDDLQATETDQGLPHHNIQRRKMRLPSRILIRRKESFKM